MTGDAGSSRSGTGPSPRRFTDLPSPVVTATNGNGSDPTDLLSPTLIAHDELVAEGIDLWVDDPAEPPEFEVYDTPEILGYEIPDVESLSVMGRHGLVLALGTNLLYSYPKTGKTELLTALTHEWVQGMRVLYLTEEPIANWKRRLAAHRFTAADYTLRMACTWGFDVHKAVRLIESETFDVLVVDTLRNTVGYLEGEGDKDVARVLVPLFRAAVGKTVICSYHARKMPGEGGRDISGHHSLYGAFDRAIQLVPVEGKESHRRLTVSGRCMYEGEVSLEYRQTAPCRFEVLDGVTVVEPKQRVSHSLQCLDCGELFEARRRNAKYCSDACWARSKRKSQKLEMSTDSELDVSEITEIPLEKASISDTFDVTLGDWDE